MIRILTPFAASQETAAASSSAVAVSICRVCIPCSRHIFLSRKMIFCNMFERAKLPSSKETTAEFLVANKPTSIPTLSGCASEMAQLARLCQRNLFRMSTAPSVGRSPQAWRAPASFLSLSSAAAVAKIKSFGNLFCSHLRSDSTAFTAPRGFRVPIVREREASVVHLLHFFQAKISATVQSTRKMFVRGCEKFIPAIA